VRRSVGRRSAGAFAALCWLILFLSPGSPLTSGSAAAVDTAIAPSTTPSDALFARAAVALRRHDCAAAMNAFTPLLARPAAVSGFTALVAGLFAHSCESTADAEAKLFKASDPGGALEDWRLYLLADSAQAQGHVLLARAALARLVGDYPASPLRPRAMLRAARFAWEQGDPARSLALVEAARREGLRGEEATELEALAWEIGTRLGDTAVRAEAARRLLVDAPARAAVLGVADSLRAPSGELFWSSFLSTEQLKRRSQSLLALELEPSALATLEAVGQAARDVDWHLLEAEVLARLHRGAEAMLLLAAVKPGSPREEAALEWARATAAADLATAQRGRNNAAAAERQRFRQEMQQHLRRIASLGADPALAVRALRLLYVELAEQNLFDSAMEVLRRLRAFDPQDATGANNLWARGWQEFSRGNYSGAVGYWAVLQELYPQDSGARRGRYWTARAFDALGEHARARDIYTEIAASDTDDFYRRNAFARMGKRLAPTGVVPAVNRVREPWPNDPVLVRARLLTDLGLDALAREELTLVKDRAQPLAVKALEALLLAREGNRRESVLAIREAFPALGGPFQAGVPEEALHLYYPLEYQEPIRTWSRAHHVPPYLVDGIIRQESAFDANAKSAAGARGLMQLMPATARELARSLGLSFSQDRMDEPAFNVQVGTLYLRQVLSMFDNNLELALAGYNGGPFRIKRLWHQSGSPDLDRFLEGLTIEQSKVYVKRILVLSDSYRQLYPDAG
jgi:soluble lytic murein transglycosylase-like protein